MRNTEIQPVMPIQTVRSNRSDVTKFMSSGDAGKLLPLMYAPLLREDAVRRGKVRMTVGMQETAEMLANGIFLRVHAHVVPFLAFSRFNGSMTELNKSYAGEAGIGGSVVPFFNTATGQSAVDTTGTLSEFLQTMGIHHGDDNFNYAIRDAYNLIWNYRAQAKSKDITLRNETDNDIAPAFWLKSSFNDVKASFDDALIDGKVQMSGLTFKAPVFSSGYNNQGTDAGFVKPQANETPTLRTNSVTPGGTTLNAYEFDRIWAELTSGGDATMSLADIEKAKQTAAFAKMRQKYDMHEDRIIDMLMDGIRVEEQTLRDPILVDSQTTMFGYSQRFATDSANLDKSVTNGLASVELNLRTPRINTGGILMVTAEIIPDQMYERKQDTYLSTTSTTTLPSFVRDYLDPQQVRTVTNAEVDTNHSNPTNIFGYAPMNSQWERNFARVGGKYYRPANDAFTEDRSSIWSLEENNPTLSESFYVCPTLHKKVFADQTEDSFELMGEMNLQIEGNTVFGGRLEEATDDYDDIQSDVDQTRITPA
jgi:hypothetical protein